MSWHLGIDTSNYTTSVAVWNSITNEMLQQKLKLPVKPGELGLRQSDAVFAHTKQLGKLIDSILRQVESLNSVGVSVRPRDIEGSYMPCFLVGKLAATAVAATAKVPLYRFSHQAGHIGAVLFGSESGDLLEKDFIAFHFSGGTSESIYVTRGENIPFNTAGISSSSDLYAGQAIDRVGGMLGLSFPSGAELEKLALKSDKIYKLKPYVDKSGNPSISGLENQCRKMLNSGEEKENIARYCIDFVCAVIDQMTEYALQLHPEKPVIYSGGVMSNSIIREYIENKYGGKFAVPEYSADNAAGIAFLAGKSYERKTGI